MSSRGYLQNGEEKAAKFLLSSWTMLLKSSTTQLFKSASSSPSWNSTPSLNLSSCSIRSVLLPFRKDGATMNLCKSVIAPPTPLIVWCPTREKAIKRMKRALSDTIITGVPTTIEYHKLIVEVETSRMERLHRFHSKALDRLESAPGIGGR